MKKILSIIFSLVILLSGTHFTVATHYCGGKLAATKISFSGKLATCGMENDNDIHQGHSWITSDCCMNKLATLTTDSQFAPSYNFYKEISQNLVMVYFVPSGSDFSPITFDDYYFSHVLPPGNTLVSSVSLSRICSFLS